MWASGRLADISADRVLLMLGARSSTGTLSVQHDDVLAVRLSNGEITGADALKESFSHGLGRILVAAGHLNRDQVAAIEAAELEGTVIDHLLANQLVPADTLAGCVRQHTYLLLVRLLSWKVGDYHFYEGEVPWTIDLRPISVEELLVRASEEDPGLLGVTVDALGAEVLKPLLGRRAFHVLSWQEDPGADRAGELWLTSFEDGLLRSLDGLTPSCDFKDRLGVDEFRLRFALHRLHQAGLVEVVRPAPGAVAPPPARPHSPIVEELERPPMPAPAPSAAPPVDDRAERTERATVAARLSELGTQLSDLSRAFSYTLAAGLAIVVLALVLAGGSTRRLHHPFPWQESARQRFESLRLDSIHHDLTGKLKTYHILYGTFPLDLRPLVDTGIVRPRDLEDNQGRDVSFESLEQGFVLGLEEGLTPLRSRYTVSGDFLLDPGFTRVEGELAESAIQVLD
jgi:hypothetical protein